MKRLLQRWRAPLFVTAGVQLCLWAFSLALSGQPLRELFSLWVHRDGFYYIDLARNGYRAMEGGTMTVVWYPFYPFLIKLLTYLTKDYGVSAVLIPTLCSFVGAVLLFELVRMEEGEGLALRAVWFWSVFPTAYFLRGSYAESLFTAMAIGAFLALKRGSVSWSAALAALAAVTRVNGIFLLPALLAEAYETARWEGRAAFKPLLARLWPFALAPFGLLTYLAINWTQFKSPLFFMRAYPLYFSQGLAWPWQALWGLAASVWKEPLPYQLFEGLALGLAWLGGLYVLLRLRRSYGVYILLNAFLFTCTLPVRSVPRYLLALFPLFILAGRVKNKWALAGLSAASLALLFYYSAFYLRQVWAF